MSTGRIDNLDRRLERVERRLDRALLDKSPRAKAVLDLAAEKAGWGQLLPRGVGRGVSVQFTFATYMAQIRVFELASRRRRFRIYRPLPCLLAAIRRLLALLDRRPGTLVFLLYQKGSIFQAQDRAIDNFTLKGVCAGII
jgi:hypothetical protein